MDRDIADEGPPSGLPALTERLGRLILELTAIKAALLDSPTASPAPRALSDSLHQKLLALFAQPVTGPISQALSPYQEVSPGIRIGFAEDADLRLTVAPKHDYSASPEACLNVLRLSLGSGSWLSIEIALAAAMVASAGRYQFGLSARPSAEIACRLLLIQRPRQNHEDILLGEFRMHPAERSYNLSGALARPDAGDGKDAADWALIAIVETAPGLDLELNYLNLYFA